jgi:hypothetical protein
MSDKFNSKSAEELAKKYKLSPRQIVPTSKKGKITIDDVKKANKKTKKIAPTKKIAQSKKIAPSKKSSSHKKTKKSSSPKSSGWNIEIELDPILEVKFNRSLNNMNEFKKWYNEMLPLLNQRGLFGDPTALVNIKSVVVKNETTINIKLKVNNITESEADLLISEIKENLHGTNVLVDLKYNGDIVFVKNRNTYVKSPEYIPGYDAEDDEPNFQLVYPKNLKKKISKL